MDKTYIFVGVILIIITCILCLLFGFKKNGKDQETETETETETTNATLTHALTTGFAPPATAIHTRATALPVSTGTTVKLTSTSALLALITALRERSAATP